MSIHSYSFHYLPLNLQNKEIPKKGIDFPLSLLKLSNKRRKKYYKIILFIQFHSIPFSPPKQWLKETKTTEGDKGKKVRDLWVERESRDPLKRDEGKNRDKSL